MKHRRFGAAIKALSAAGRGRPRLVFLLVATLAFAGCKENLGASVPGLGPDTSGPLVALHPAHDTLVDSTGTLLVRVAASDRSGVGMVLFNIVPPTHAIDSLMPNDTVFNGLFPVTLGSYKHGTFKYWVLARDVLDHETVTDTVTVTVR